MPSATATATASPWLPLFTPSTSSTTLTKTPILKTCRNLNTNYNNNNKSVKCKASNRNMNMDLDLDLYDLMGIDSTSNKSQIKTAYRLLQKRCHPDIAGPAGHEMAIILNEAYSVLADPTSRLAYDKEQAKISELQGYTGKPLYSVWFGSESEERAVFVDEVKCVGCLKCALFADKTFAVESVYGRARVVAQWADPENKIHDAIQSCPVDCISIVERSDLAALEYLMSKQPRGNVRVGAGNSVGTRVSNIFVDVKKFQAKFADAKNKAARKEEDINWEVRLSAIQAIRSISNWLYWQSPASESYQNLTYTGKKSNEPNIKKLQDAAAARKQATYSTKTIRNGKPSDSLHYDEYWMPSTQALPASASTQTNSSSCTAPKAEPPSNRGWTKQNERVLEENRRNPIAWGLPVVTAAIAAAIVRLQVVSQGAADGLKEHIGGSLALEVVNSSWLQVILAGITWYYIGVAVVELIEVIGNKQE
ncbi:Chaperone protein DnaJ [Melia azedarach]|uniref:Chaperone protein DnaJ n=1 Tax=Melia azedarach TaxID=155640 RepID=A0ACC1XH53_MELAZ|nr:Chaperone protein DnaJ [Melia azedarach]